MGEIVGDGLWGRGGLAGWRGCLDGLGWRLAFGPNGTWRRRGGGVGEGGAHGAGVEALEGVFGFADELGEALGGFAIDAEVAGPVGDGGGVEGNLVAD